MEVVLLTVMHILTLMILGLLMGWCIWSCFVEEYSYKDTKGMSRFIFSLLMFVGTYWSISLPTSLILHISWEKADKYSFLAAVLSIIILAILKKKGTWYERREYRDD